MAQYWQRHQSPGEHGLLATSRHGIDYDTTVVVMVIDEGTIIYMALIIAQTLSSTLHLNPIMNSQFLFPPEHAGYWN